MHWEGPLRGRQTEWNLEVWQRDGDLERAEEEEGVVIVRTYRSEGCANAQGVQGAHGTLGMCRVCWACGGHAVVDGVSGMRRLCWVGTQGGLCVTGGVHCVWQHLVQ